MEEEMNQNEYIGNLIDWYTNLQRILSNDNPKAEAEYQLQIIKAKLEACKIMTSKLERKS